MSTSPITRVPAHSTAASPNQSPQSQRSQYRLYFAPLACSLATRIAFHEAGLDVEYVQVDTKAKRLVAGGDYREIHPLGQVPVLELAPDLRLSENAAILQYVADHHPDAGLGPTDGFARARLRQWLSFIGTELHKAVFAPLLDRTLDAAVHAHA